MNLSEASQDMQRSERTRRATGRYVDVKLVSRHELSMRPVPYLLKFMKPHFRKWPGSTESKRFPMLSERGTIKTDTSKTKKDQDKMKLVADALLEIASASGPNERVNQSNHTVEDAAVDMFDSHCAYQDMPSSSKSTGWPFKKIPPKRHIDSLSSPPVCLCGPYHLMY